MKFCNAAVAFLSLIGVSLTSQVQAQGLGLGAVLPPPIKVGCNWFLAYGPGSATGNTAFPESNAHYWLAVVSESVPPGSRLRIEGEIPSGRYSAFHVHNGNLEVMDSIADFRLKPNTGSANPYLSPTRYDSGSAFGGAYTAFLRFHTPVPAQREQNTLYRPAPKALEGVTRKRTVLSYRTYLKNSPLDTLASLPKLSLQTPAGTVAFASNSVDNAACASLRDSYAQNGAALPGSANLVDPVLPALRPAFKKYAGAAYGALGLALPTSTGTVGYNPQNGFLYVKTNTSLGELLVVRGKAPSYTTQPSGPADPQVRYWSLCQYGFNSQKVVGCGADRTAVLDAMGYYTFVISPDALRPPLATTARGFKWMSWGPEAGGDVILRYLLENPAFDQSIDKVPLLQAPTRTMGEYAPLATYCSRAVFNAAAAAGPEMTFASCLASRNL